MFLRVRAERIFDNYFWRMDKDLRGTSIVGSTRGAELADTFQALDPRTVRSVTFLLCENRREIGKSLKLKGIATWVEKEHRRLFSDFAHKSYLWFDQKSNSFRD